MIEFAALGAEIECVAIWFSEMAKANLVGAARRQFLRERRVVESFLAQLIEFGRENSATGPDRCEPEAFAALERLYLGIVRVNLFDAGVSWDEAERQAVSRLGWTSDPDSKP